MLLFFCVLWTTAMHAQQNLIKITGKVTDAHGNSLTGVTIQVKDSDTYASTDDSGNYSLQAARSSILTFS